MKEEFAARARSFVCRKLAETKCWCARRRCFAEDCCKTRRGANWRSSNEINRGATGKNHRIRQIVFWRRRLGCWNQMICFLFFAALQVFSRLSAEGRNQLSKFFPPRTGKPDYEPFCSVIAPVSPDAEFIENLSALPTGFPDYEIVFVVDSERDRSVIKKFNCENIRTVCGVISQNFVSAKVAGEAKVKDPKKVHQSAAGGNL